MVQQAAAVRPSHLVVIEDGQTPDARFCCIQFSAVTARATSVAPRAPGWAALDEGKRGNYGVD
jgi:hypothetical protein